MKQDAPERLNLPDSSSESDGFDVLEAAIQGILGEEEIFMAPFIPTDDQPIVYVPPPPPPTPPTSRPSPEVQNLVQNKPPQQEEQEWSSNDSVQSATSSMEQNVLDLSTHAGPSQPYQTPATTTNHQDSNPPMEAGPSQVVSEAEYMDLDKLIECPFSDYLKHSHHEVPLGNLLVHMTQCPMGQQLSFCEHCFQHAPIYVIATHVWVCPENPNATTVFASESD